MASASARLSVSEVGGQLHRRDAVLPAHNCRRVRRHLALNRTINAPSAKVGRDELAVEERLEREARPGDPAVTGGYGRGDHDLELVPAAIPPPFDILCAQFYSTTAADAGVLRYPVHTFMTRRVGWRPGGERVRCERREHCGGIVESV